MKPINLRQARKQRQRLKKSVEASENAAKFGRTKAEKSRDTEQVTRLGRHLDSHKREE